MAFRKTLIDRLFNMPKILTPSLTNCRISSSSSSNKLSPARATAPDPGDNGYFRLFLHKRAILPPTMTSEFRSFPAGDNKLMEKLRRMGIVRDRIRLDGLTPPETKKSDLMMVGRLSVEDARKLLKLAQLEVVKSNLRQIPRSWISHSEFVQICGEGCSDSYQGLEFAKTLDQSGIVIVLGNVVFLRPEQVVKTIEGLIPAPLAHPNDPRRKELEEMEKHKATIDMKAESLVRRELWLGLGYFVIQTAGFMRLTFWELSWDVMEPICFYVTSAYFMAGYAFFLRTSKEPSFEGFFQSRFCAKQKRLMERENFNIGRYNELRKAFYPHSSLEQTSSPTPLFDNSKRADFGALQSAHY